MLNIELPGFLEDRRGGEGSLAPAEISGGRHTLGDRAREQVRSESGPAGSRRSLGKGGSVPGGDRDHPLSALIPHLAAQGGVSGRFICAGPSVELLPCHLSPPSRPYRPRASTHQNSLGAQAWNPGLFPLLIHKALCTYTSSPIEVAQRGSPSGLLLQTWACVSWCESRPRSPWGLLWEGILWEYRLGSARGLLGRSRRCGRWDPLRPRPWR